MENVKSTSYKDDVSLILVLTKVHAIRMQQNLGHAVSKYDSPTNDILPNKIEISQDFSEFL